MIRLLQEFGAHAGRELSFDQARLGIGRAPTNEVAFDPHVDLDSSGNHCEIVFENGVYLVQDLNSRNGTYVNGARIHKQRLAPNDVIECGRGGPRLRVQIPAPPPAVMSGPQRAMPVYAGHAPTAAMEAMVPFHRSTSPAGPPSGAIAPSQAYPLQPPLSQPPPQHVPGFAAPIGTPVAGFGSPGTGLPGYAPPPIGASGSGFQPVPAASSPGAAAVSRLPQHAQVGKRTMALMIDEALMQAGVRKTNTGVKVVAALGALALLTGLGIGGWALWDEREAADERLEEARNTGGGGQGNAGARISQANESAIYMLASVQPGRGPQGFCTAFGVTSDLLATNAHCVDAAQEYLAGGRTLVALRNNGRGVQIPIQPVYRDPRFHNTSVGLDGSGYDVGIVRATQPLPTQVRLATVAGAMTVTPGSDIFVYGFPGMTMNETSPVATITSGVLSRMTDFFDRAADNPSLAQKIQHSAQTTAGSSGSPIFLASGEVIGINAGSLADQERQSIIDPNTGQRTSVEVARSSNFKYGMRADLIRAAIQAVGETAP